MAAVSETFWSGRLNIFTKLHMFTSNVKKGKVQILNTPYHDATRGSRTVNHTVYSLILRSSQYYYLLQNSPLSFATNIHSEPSSDM